MGRSNSERLRIGLGHPPVFAAVQITGLLDMTGVRSNDRERHAQKVLGDDSGDLEAVKVSRLDLP